MNPLFPLPPDLWRQRYEALRQHVLERRQSLGADPMGLVLLVRQGVAGWMEEWGELTERALQPLAPAHPPPCPSPPGWQQQLTVLLAHMTAPHLQPTLSL